MLSPYCLHLGGLLGGKVFLDADSWDIPGDGFFWLRPKNVTTDFPPMRLFFAHQQYSEYPASLITFYSIRTLETILCYVVYFVFALRKSYFYVFSYVFVAPVSVPPPLLPPLDMPVLWCGNPTWDISLWYCRVSSVITKGESVNGKNKRGGGLAYNCPNFVKGDLVAHISRYSFAEVIDFFMDVLQKSQARPQTKLHDKYINIYWHIEFHHTYGS